MATKKLSSADVTAQIQQEITDKIVEALEAGTRPWVKGWQATGGLALRSCGLAYQGVNQFLLGLQAAASGYGSQFWLTFKQAQADGLQVRKGEKSTRVVFQKPLIVKDEKSEDGTKKIFILKTYSVFNLDQLEGEVPAKYAKSAIEAVRNPEERDEAAETALRACGAVIREDGGDRAYYHPALDSVHMPRFQDFKSAGDYLTTLAHELVHWTGHASRLGRKFGGSFGSPDYAREELVAELGAAMVCAILGVAGDHLDNHAAYLASWIKVLKDDRKAIFKAASAASAASNLVLEAHMAAQAIDPDESEEMAMAA